MGPVARPAWAASKSASELAGGDDGTSHSQTPSRKLNRKATPLQWRWSLVRHDLVRVGGHARGPRHDRCLPQAEPVVPARRGGVHQAEPRRRVDRRAQDQGPERRRQPREPGAGHRGEGRAVPGRRVQAVGAQADLNPPALPRSTRTAPGAPCGTLQGRHTIHTTHTGSRDRGGNLSSDG